MYILKLTIDRRAQAFVNARNSVAEMHSRVCSLFPEVDGNVDLKSHSKYGVLWRYDWDRHKPGSGEYLIVTSTRTSPVPSRHYPEANYEIKSVPDDWPRLEKGGLYNFRLVGSPVRNIKSENGRGRRHGLTRPDDLRAWLERRFSTVPGRPDAHQWATLEDLRYWGAAYQPRSFLHKGEKGNGDAVKIWLVQFDGTIRITDPNIASHIVREGVATSGKSYGAGLLSLSRASYPTGNTEP